MMFAEIKSPMTPNEIKHLEEIKFSNYSRASTARQSAIPKATRTARARAAANARWAGVDMVARKAHSAKMIAARSYNGGKNGQCGHSITGNGTTSNGTTSNGTTGNNANHNE